MLAAPSTATCEGTSLAPPLDGNLELTSPFDPPRHFGSDYATRDANGTPTTGKPVRSVADGTIDTIGFDERPLPKPDPRSGKTVKGWGHYVVIRHKDGSATLYAHLDGPPSVAPSATVESGDVIGLSGESGGASGPHLHIEYAPDGNIFNRDSKVDPAPCIDKNFFGSITVRDNGSLADDAFSIAINGLLVCQTSIGASNTCGVGNLRPGTATLTIVAVIAPDNVGTYEISLADGLTFAGGSTVRSGTLPQGGAASFSIIIPTP